MLSLALARGWYTLLGALAVLATLGGVAGTLSGSMFEWYLAVAGIGVGLLSLGAALWVQARTRTRAIVAWLGIVALGCAFLIPLTWSLGSARDMIVYAVLPTTVGLLAAGRMALARARTPFGLEPPAIAAAPVDAV